MYESEKWKWKWSRVWLLATPWTAAYQAPPSMGFSRQEYWSGVPLPSPIWTTAKQSSILESCALLGLGLLNLTAHSYGWPKSLAITLKHIVRPRDLAQRPQVNKMWMWIYPQIISILKILMNGSIQSMCACSVVSDSLGPQAFSLSIPFQGLSNYLPGAKISPLFG